MISFSEVVQQLGSRLRTRVKLPFSRIRTSLLRLSATIRAATPAEITDAHVLEWSEQLAQLQAFIASPRVAASIHSQSLLNDLQSKVQVVTDLTLTMRTGDHVLNRKILLDQIHNSVRCLNDIESAYVRRSAWHRRFSLLCWALPPLIATLSLLYLYQKSGLYVTNTRMHFPFDIEEPGTSTCVLKLSPEQEEEYIRAFSQFYFHKPNAFSKRYLEQRKTSATIVNGLEISVAQPYRFKIDIAHASYMRTQFVSSAVLRVRCEQANAFPWGKLDTQPNIELTYTPYPLDHSASEPPDSISDRIGSRISPGYHLRNDGIGPAIDVQSTLKTESNVLISRTETDILFTGFIDHYLPSPGDTISPWPLRFAVRRGNLGVREFPDVYLLDPDNAGLRRHQEELYSPLFGEVKSGNPHVGPAFFEHGGKWYEIVSDVQSLRRYTEVLLNESIVLDVKYKSLRNIVTTKRSIQDWPRGWCLYRRNQSVLEFDPRKARPTPSRYIRDEGGAAPFSPDRFALAFVPPPYDPKGVDHIQCVVDAHVQSIREGEFGSGTSMVDKFLNPQGTISVYATVHGAKSGVYRCEILVDGQVIASFSFQAIAPDRLKFPQEHNDDLSAQREELQKLKPFFATGH